MLLAGACSVYPETFWGLTLWLGEKLLDLDKDGTDGRRTEILIRLTSLPWFRHGRIPNWIRVRFLKDLREDDAEKARGLIETYLDGAKSGAGDLEIGLTDRGPTAPVRDYVMFSFLLGEKVDETLLANAPKSWERWLYERGRRVLGPRLWLAGIAAVLLGAAAWFGAHAALSLAKVQVELSTWALPPAADVHEAAPGRKFPPDPGRRAVLEVADAMVGQAGGADFEDKVVKQAIQFVGTAPANRIRLLPKGVPNYADTQIPADAWRSALGAIKIPSAGLAFNGGFIESVSGLKAIVIRSNAKIERTSVSLPKGPYRDYVSLFGVANGSDLSSAASCIAREGATFVLRFYAPDEVMLTRGEDQALSAAGLKVVAIYLESNDTLGAFSASSGTQQAMRAIQLANNAGQPKGSAIYFLMNYDATDADIQGPITAFFRAISGVFAQAKSDYFIGISSYPLLSKKIIHAGLAKYSITGGSAVFAKIALCGEDHDLLLPDDANSMGAFQVKAGSPPPQGQAPLAPGNKSGSPRK
jgi:hypothetical protein